MEASEIVDLMYETWIDIKGYEGIYQVSSLGNVRSLDRKRKTHHGGEAKIRGVVLKKALSNTGYFVVNLCGKTHLVHRLIAAAFIPNPKNLRCVNHIDENRQNNCLRNLEWVTHKENSNHGTLPQKMKVYSTRHTFCLGGRNHTLREWSRITGISYQTLYSRIFTHCWPIEKTLTIIPNHGNNIKKIIGGALNE